MTQSIYEIPSTLLELFENGETTYRIIDHSEEMDNAQALSAFLMAIGVTDDNIVFDHGTEAGVCHPDYRDVMVIDSYGLGDFFSHGFTVTERDNG